MNPCFQKLFLDTSACKKLTDKLPEAFEIADLDYPRAMEVGIPRQRIFTAFMVWYFGSEYVQTTVATDLFDALVCGHPLSIKTITKNGGVKAKWTSDNGQATQFMQNYYPVADMVLIHVWWGRERDSLYYIPVEVQQELFNEVEREEYLVNRPNTNNRGVEYRNRILRRMESHPGTMKLPVKWEKIGVDYDPYQRWLEFWEDP